MPSTSSGPAECRGLDLRTIWDVDADETYDVRRKYSHRPQMIAIRTRGGEGAVHLDNGTVFRLLPNTLLIVEDQRIVRYHCVGTCWKFWWFEFLVQGPPFFPLQVICQAPEESADEADFTAMFAELRHLTYLQRSLASARLLLMLHRWLARWKGDFNPSRHARLVDRIIELMHARIQQNWTVGEMAHEAHLCERQFRKIFTLETGKAPKFYYDELRMIHARKLLQLGSRTIAEISEQLGFSSPAHFSKSFKHFFRTSPSDLSERS
jgi:AraC-like DNA-binding protein